MTLSAAQLRPWVGAYRDPASGAVTEIVQVDGALVAVIGQRRVPLVAVSADRLRLGVGPPFVTRMERPGATRRLRIEREGQPPQLLDAVELVSPTPAELAEYADTYASEELQTAYSLRIAGDTLRIHRRIGAPMPLRPTIRDAFSSTGPELPGIRLSFRTRPIRRRVWLRAAGGARPQHSLPALLGGQRRAGSRADRVWGGTVTCVGGSMPLVFIYGTLMRGRANHGVLKRLGATFVGAAWTPEPRILVDLGPYPALTDPEAPDAPIPAGPVFGELWTVPESALAPLDDFEGCPELYKRVSVAVETADGTWMDVFVYVFARRLPRLASVIRSGRYEGIGEALPEGARPEDIATHSCL